MNTPLLLGSVYAGQLLLKAALAEYYARRHRSGRQEETAEAVTLVQPILGGDPALASTLEANVLALPDARFLWLVDTDDLIGLTVTQGLAARHRGRAITLLRCPPPSQGENPKVAKLALALDAVETPVFVVLDDDTRLSAEGLHALQSGLAQGATLATGLPRYHAAHGAWSGWLAEFVNSAAVLTYLPALAFSDPLSIHGMCYAMRTEDARRLDVFRRIARCLTDDLALALLLREQGLRLHQTVVPHDIATSVPSFTALRGILHRWFVFTRLLVASCPFRVRLPLAAAYLLPPLLLAALLVLALFSLQAAAVLAATLVLRWGLLRCVKRRFLGAKVGDLPLASLATELAQPFLLAQAWGSRRIRWRSRSIKVHAIDRFDYL